MSENKKKTSVIEDDPQNNPYNHPRKTEAGMQDYQDIASTLPQEGRKRLNNQVTTDQ